MIATATITEILPKIGEIPQWRQGSWEDFLEICNSNDPNLDRVRVFFNEGYIFVEMGQEGINHALFSNIYPVLFFIWFTRKAGETQAFKCLGRCVIEKPKQRAACPDQVLYIGSGAPIWQEGEPRRINLDNYRLPDLVGEVSDTTIATDLDEKKQLYAALQIPEYWVTDVRGKRVLAFRLQADGKYEECEYSLALEGLPIALLNDTLQKLSQEDHATAALWFAQQINKTLSL